MTAETNNDRKQGQGQGLRTRARALAQLPGGRRTKFAVVGVWVLIAIAIGPLSGKFEDAQKNDPADYLPGSAESVKALEDSRTSPPATIADAITVFHRDGGLTAADRAAIDDTRGGDQRRARARAWARPARRVLAGRQHGAADHPDQGRGRQQRGRGPAGRHHRRHQGRSRRPARRPRGQGDRAGRLLRRRDRRLRRHRRHAALRDRGARPGPADRHLPQPDLLADPVLLRAARRGQLARLRLSARRGRA